MEICTIDNDKENVDLTEILQYLEPSDINEMLKTSITIADIAMVSKIIQYVFKFKKQMCEKLLQTTDYYENLYVKLFTNLNYQIKFSLNCIVTTLYLYPNESTNICIHMKTQLIGREGFLKRLATLFLISNEKSPYWYLLCVCITELSMKYEEVQKYCSFILPVCLQHLNSSEIVVLNLTTALVQNNIQNQEKIVDLGGLRKIRHLIKYNIGIELLYHILSDCSMAISEFNNEKMYEDIEEIIEKSSKITNEWKWSKLIIEKFKDIGHSQKIVPHSNAINSKIYSETQYNVLENSLGKYDTLKNLNVMGYYSRKITRETSNVISNNFMCPPFTKDNKIQTDASKLIVNIENEEKTTDKVKKIFNSVFNCDQQMKNFKTPNVQYTISSISRNANETELHLKPCKPVIPAKPLKNFNLPRSILKNNIRVSTNESSPEFIKTLKKLKLGIALFGTDFKKIRIKLWRPDDSITPAYLYELYKKYISKK